MTLLTLIFSCTAVCKRFNECTFKAAVAVYLVGFIACLLRVAEW